jgi:acyl-CoA thioesterase
MSTADAADSDRALAARVVAHMLAHDAFSDWLGIEVIAVEPGACTLRMTVRPDMLNGFGVCHGGVTFSLADSALAFACNGSGRITMSIENGIRYPAAARAGDVLTAVAEREASSRALGYYGVRVTNQHDVVVALFRGTVYDTKREHFSGAEQGNG